MTAIKLKSYYKCKKFQLPLYQGSKRSALHVIITDEYNWNKTCKKLRSYSDQELELGQYKEMAACAIDLEKNGSMTFFIVLTKDRGLDFNTLSHEAIHIKNKIWKSRGIKLDVNNDEPEAYFMGWLMEKLSGILLNEIVEEEINKIKNIDIDGKEGNKITGNQEGVL